MGMKRTPLRRALTRLASEGLPAPLPHRDLRVLELSYSTLLDPDAFVKAPEPLAASLALPKMNQSDFSELDEVKRPMQESLAERGCRSGDRPAQSLPPPHSRNLAATRTRTHLAVNPPARGDHRPSEGGIPERAVEIPGGNLSFATMALFGETASGDLRRLSRKMALIE